MSIQCVTPKQTCLQPDGFRRNLRSKTRWFTGFCNSHQVSHFATFFIDARAEISVAESRLVISKDVQASTTRRRVGTCTSSFHHPWRDLRRDSLFDKPTNTSPESSMHVCSRGESRRRGNWAQSTHSPFFMNKFTSFLDVRFRQ